MLNVQNRRRDFRSWATYLLRHNGEVGPERVAWTATRNLPTDDPDLVVGLMRATAALSLRVEKPAYHIAISFAPEDPVDRAIIERVADRVLTHLGLVEHQALLVAHRDRPHAHVHILVNLVHPETGRSWLPWHDWPKVRAVLRLEERALGFREQAGPKERIPALAQELLTYERVVALAQQLYRAESDTHSARERGRRLELAAERARTALARSDDLLSRVYRDPASAYRVYVAAADSLGAVQATERMRHHPDQFGALATVERWRAFDRHLKADDRGARVTLPAAATAAQEALEATRAWRQAADAEARRIEQDFDQALVAIYQDPAAARLAFEGLARERGADDAANLLRERPPTFGPLLATAGQEPQRFQEEVARAAVQGVEAVHARATATALQPNARETTPEAIRALGGAEAERAAARASALRAELQALPRRTELERRIRYGLDRLPSFELRHLKAAVTAPQWAIAMRLGRVARDIALGREEERDLSL